LAFNTSKPQSVYINNPTDNYKSVVLNIFSLTTRTETPYKCHEKNIKNYCLTLYNCKNKLILRGDYKGMTNSQAANHFTTP